MSASNVAVSEVGRGTGSRGALSLLASGLPYPECVAECADGWLIASCGGVDYLSPGPLVIFDPNGSGRRVFADLACRFLGVAVLSDGAMIACDSTNGRILRFSPNGDLLGAVASVGGWRLRKPNGIAAARDEAVWVADSGTATAGEPTGAVLYVTADGSGWVAADHLTYANGIAASPGGDAVLVTETRDNRLLRFRVTGVGKLDQGEVLAADLGDGPDGVSIDEGGTAYVAVTRTSGVAAIDPTGTVEWLVSQATELRMPSHAFVLSSRVELAVTSLFGDTVHRLRLVAKSDSQSDRHRNRSEAS